MLAALLVLASLLVLLRVRAVAPRVAEFAALETYGRVEGWLESARCTVERGVFLAACAPDGSLVPIEDSGSGIADDRGHALLANALAASTRAPVTREQLVWLHFAINAVGIFGLALALWVWTRTRLTAAFLLVAGASLAIPGPNPTSDAFASFFGAYCLGVVPGVWLAGPGWPSARASRFLRSLLVVAFAATWAALLRQPLGMIGFAAALAVLAVRGRLPEPRPTGPGRARALLRGAIAAGALFAAVSWGTAGIVGLRGALFGVPRGQKTLVHGIAHNLYIGLGTEPNSFGVQWGDTEGFAAAQAIAPSTGYVSEAHYDLLLQRWLEIVRTHPAEVASIYVHKAGKTVHAISGPGTRSLVKYLLVVAALIGGLVAVRRAADRATLRLAVGLAVGALLVALQGVLAAPGSGYLIPASFAFLLLALVLAEALLRALWRSLLARPAALAPGFGRGAEQPS